MSDSQAARVRKARSGFVIGNRFLEREIAYQQDGVVTKAFTNLLTGKRILVRSREFEIVVHGQAKALTNEDFAVRGHTVQKTSGGGQVLQFQLVNEPLGLKVVLRYDISPSAFYLRKRLTIEGGDRLVRQVSVESFDVSGQRFSYGGFGQPLFMSEEFFAGLEYPAGYNTVSKGKTVRLTHYPGRRGRVESKSAVLGVCPNTVNDRLRDWFLKYIEENRARPVRRLHTQFCRPHDRQTLGILKKAFADQGLPLDALYIYGSDEVFEPKGVVKLLPEDVQFMASYNRGRIKERIPLSKLRKLSKEMIGAGLGFHLNTGGGRGTGDHAWYREHFDMISPRYYCLADPRVKEQMQSNLLEAVRKYDAEFFSFDWMWWRTAWDCPHGGHRGHIKGVKYGREAITDAFIELATVLRKEKPEIILEDLEVDHSPWWLWYADALWSYAGEGPRMSHVFIDGSMRGWRANTVFPMNSVWYAVNPPYGWGPAPDPDPRKLSQERIKAWRRRASGLIMKPGETPLREFADNVIMQYLRGSQIDEIYYDVKYLTPDELQLYAEIMAWGRKHCKILLANTTYILGDPLKERTYGLTHFLEDNRGIIGVFNLCRWRTETVRVTLDESVHCHQNGKPVAVEVVYPYRRHLGQGFGYGDSFQLIVPGKSLVVLETRPVKRARGSRTVDLSALPVAVPDTGFSVSRRRVQTVRNRLIKTTVSFHISLPDREKVFLHVMTDIPFRRDAFLTGKKEKAQFEKVCHECLHRDATLRGMRVTEHRLLEAEMTAMIEMLQGRAIGTVGCSTRQNGRPIPMNSGENMNYRVTGIGRHPMRSVNVYAFTRHSTVKPLASGQVEVSLKMKWPHTKCHIWLEREYLVGDSEARPTAKGELPSAFETSGREVIRIL